MPQVEIYTRDFCGYCAAAKDLLERKGVEYREMNGTFDPAIRAEMVERAQGGCTFPQIFIDGRHVGGCDELYELEEAGKLDLLLAGAPAS